MAATAAAAAAQCSQQSDPNRSAPVVGRQMMVAAAHPEAATAGCTVLAHGGTAADAAVAVQAVLTVVEPQSSGFGGGTVITYFDRSTGTVRSYDGLSSSPERVTDGLRTPTEQERATFGTDKFGSEVGATGRAVGVPGTVAVLDQVHARYGKLPWKTLFDRGIDLAADGFPMPKYLHAVMTEPTNGLSRCQYPDITARYCHGATPKPVGAQIKNAELASVMREVRDGGARAFYDPRGSIAPTIVARVTAGPYKVQTDAYGPAVIPSMMTVKDFAAYKPAERDPICRTVFKQKLCTSPPGSGGVTLLQELALMERGGIHRTAPLSAERMHIAIETSRLAQLDRREYTGDPDFHKVPVDGLLADTYLDKRFALFSPDKAIHPVSPGEPESTQPSEPQGSSPATGTDTTSNVSIVDRFGNAVSMTTTINTTFGAHIEARGIMLNNVQTNFTGLDSISPGRRVNQMEPRKRPRSTIAPSLVFAPDGGLRLVVGAAGGSAILDYIAQTFLGVIVDGMDPQRAIAQGHFSGQVITGDCAGVTDAVSELEKGTAAAALLGQLHTWAHPCPRITEKRSGLTAIEVGTNDTLIGAADPRRDGAAVGG
jgi:gamma-glutamyltranspeptidase/glutathione hydrolase